MRAVTFGTADTHTYDDRRLWIKFLRRVRGVGGRVFSVHRPWRWCPGGFFAAWPLTGPKTGVRLATSGDLAHDFGGILTTSGDPAGRLAGMVCACVYVNNFFPARLACRLHAGLNRKGRKERKGGLGERQATQRRTAERTQRKQRTPASADSPAGSTRLAAKRAGREAWRPPGEARKTRSRPLCGRTDGQRTQRKMETG